MALITELHRADLPGAAPGQSPAPTPTTTPPAASSPRRLTVPAQSGLTGTSSPLTQPGPATHSGPVAQPGPMTQAVPTTQPGLTPPRQLDLLELQEQIAQDAEAAEERDAAAGGAGTLHRQEPSAGLSVGWYFPAERRCAHHARRWFGDLLRATWPDRDAADACELAFGEVVANAVGHGGGGAVRVEVRLDERACRFEITDGVREIGFGAPGPAQQDADAAAPTRCPEADAPGAITPRRAGCLAESGRGLEMLGLLCDHWSVRAAAHGYGKTVSVVAGSVCAH